MLLYWISLLSFNEDVSVIYLNHIQLISDYPHPLIKCLKYLRYLSRTNVHLPQPCVIFADKRYILLRFFVFLVSKGLSYFHYCSFDYEETINRYYISTFLFWRYEHSFSFRNSIFSGTGTDKPSGGKSFHLVLVGIESLNLCSICRPCVILSFILLWFSHCLSFLELWLLITPLVSSNSSLNVISN